MSRLPCIILICLLTAVFACKSDYQVPASAEVVIRLPNEPAKLGALYAAGYADASRVAAQIFQPLLDWDPETLEIVPVVVESLPTITPIVDGPFAGGAKHEYTIREEAVWSDGQSVTAADMHYTLKSMVNTKAGLQRISPIISFVKKFEVDPANPKKFTAYSDSQYMLAEMALGNMPVLPKHILDPNGVLDKYTLEDLRNAATYTTADSTALIDLGTVQASDSFNRYGDKLMGSGPYEFESWTAGAEIVLKKKENWWGDKIASNNMLEARPQTIKYVIVKDEPAAITMLKDGQLDAMSAIAPTAFVQLKENSLAKEQLELSNPPIRQYYFVGMNMKNVKLSDIMVRRALAHAIDYNALIDNMLYGMGQRIAGPLHPGHYAYDNELSLPDYNPETSVFFLEEAGWRDTNGNGIRDKMIDGNKVELTMSLLASPSENSKNIGLLVQSSAAKIGIDIQPVFKELRTLVSNDIVPGKFDMFALAWSQSLDDYDPTLLWHTKSQKGGRNWVGYGTPETDAVIDELIYTTDAERRLELYHTWQRDVVAAQPYLFLCAPTERIAINKAFDAAVSAKKPGLFESLFEVADGLSGQ